MSKSKKKIVFTGGNGRFGQVLQKAKLSDYKVFFPKKSQLDITNYNSVKKYIKKIKPNIYKKKIR